MNRFVAGAIAGTTATVAMTAAMRLLYRRLPDRERYPLPPRLITERVAPAALLSATAERERRDLALGAHYAYGAATGALYPTLARRIGGPPLLTGVGYGLGVWAASYLGWIPAAGILTPATRHPRRRTALMLAAHVVWGAVTGLVADGLDGRPRAASPARRPGG
ncbi:hypothetical protein [Azospirillum sp. ST 5-10]|uniref:hypothetical protein n=1 Tax=unclassified Azospirillum TaxID=2630922 RepID=UPI003F49EC11